MKTMEPRLYASPAPLLKSHAPNDSRRAIATGGMTQHDTVLYKQLTRQAHPTTQLHTCTRSMPMMGLLKPLTWNLEVTKAHSGVSFATQTRAGLATESSQYSGFFTENWSRVSPWKSCPRRRMQTTNKPEKDTTPHGYHTRYVITPRPTKVPTSPATVPVSTLSNHANYRAKRDTRQHTHLPEDGNSGGDAIH